MLEQQNFSSQNTLLRLPQVLKLIPVGRSTWWRWVAEGKAPQGVKLGPRTTVWRLSDIQKLIESRLQGGGE